MHKVTMGVLYIMRPSQQSSPCHPYHLHAQPPYIHSPHPTALPQDSRCPRLPIVYHKQSKIRKVHRASLASQTKDHVNLALMIIGRLRRSRRAITCGPRTTPCHARSGEARAGGGSISTSRKLRYIPHGRQVTSFGYSICLCISLHSSSDWQ